MKRTDWDAYYQRPFFASRFTRRFTAARLVSLIARHAPRTGRPLDIAELGGANSCFFDLLQRRFAPRRYHILDFNRYGLDLMRKRVGDRPDVHCHHLDVLDSADPGFRADVVFSIGLIEHFDPGGTRRAIQAHLRLARPGALVVISFPTPTRLYRASRAVAEATGRWAFPDERPLQLPEVQAVLGVPILDHSIVWPVLLTQMFVAARAPAG